MILDYIFFGITTAIVGLFSLLNTLLPKITAFPFGDSLIKGGILALHALTLVFWPLSPVINCLFIYIGVKIGILLLRFILGARAPVHHNL